MAGVLTIDPFAMGAALVRANQDRMHAVSPFSLASGSWTGDKFAGGFGPTKVGPLDYWTLRKRSGQLFRENLYARGLLRRLCTNEISTGLTLDAEPNEELLPDSAFGADGPDEWSENVTSRFEVYSDNPRMCDWEERRTFGELQSEARMESLIEGDILVQLRSDRQTQLPKVQLLSGSKVTTPGNKLMDPHVTHGVVTDDRGRQTGYYVQQDDGTHRLVPAYGSRTGRRMAWLIYGTDKRTDEVRGTPLLGLVMQSLKELDRYQDAELRAAVVNAMVAMFITKNADKPGTLPFSGGAVRNQINLSTSADGGIREFRTAGAMPGMVLEELQTGERPEGFDPKRPNVNHAAFTEGVLGAIAWANEIPPEVLMLRYSSNFSASKAAISEFRGYLMKFRRNFGHQFCRWFYLDWLHVELMRDAIKAPGLLEAWNDRQQYDIFGGWTLHSWGGPVKPSLELSKEVKAYAEAVAAGFCSADRASTDLFGVRFRRVTQRRKRERKMEMDAGLAPEPEAISGAPGAPGAPGAVDPVTGLTPAGLDAVLDKVLDLLEEQADEETLRAA